MTRQTPPRSLEHHLTRTLAAVILVAGFVAGAASFALAYRDAQELQDDTLRQVAVLADRATANGASGEGDVWVHDAETRVIVAPLARGPRPDWLPADLPVGFHILHGQNESWRVYVRDARVTGRIAVAQSTKVRDEIAMNAAIRTLVPLVLILPLLIWLVARTVRHELAPVRELAHVLDQQPAEQPRPIAMTRVPEEVAPFAHAINRLLERVGRLVEAQRRFVADAAHELRSPLTALSLQAQNVEQASSLDAARERMALLRAGIERARHLAEQLLSLARSQSAATRPERLQVATVVRELVAEQLPLAEARGVDLGMGGVDEALVLDTDGQLLSVVLKNALDNALRYTPQGGEVTITCFGGGEACIIEIADTGPGIQAAERERAFAPFHRLDNSVGTGSGLGLAIARDAAARIGGAAVSLNERPGRGLVFRYQQRRASAVAVDTRA